MFYYNAVANNCQGHKSKKITFFGVKRLFYCFCGVIVFIMEKKISINDIAAACNVSAMTVSRALRQSSKVRQATRELILAKAEELGYFKLSRLGRPEVQKNSAPARVRLILGGSGSTVSIFHSRLVNTIQRNLIRHNCECVLFSNDASYQSFLILSEALKRQSADATIIIGDFPEGQLKSLLMSCPGAILLDNPGLEEFDATFSSFNFDNYAGCSAMLEHLLASGRRRIVLLNGSKEHFFSQAMEKAYREKLARYNIKVDEEMILNADFTAHGAAKVMQDFMRKNIKFDAVFSNDEMALGVYRTLLSCNINIPGEVALAGCDNLPLGQMLYPALSTVDLDYGLLADHAIKFILERSEVFNPKRLLIKPELLVRESTLK